MSIEMNNDQELIDLTDLAEMLREEENIEENLEENLEEKNKINTAQIFRFKFTEEFMVDLYKFAKIHQYDHRKDFKEAWTVWTEENEDLVLEETDRLHNLGYDGDILDKMFKSARYYFRKKSPVKAEPKQRRQYISVSHELLEAMDAHIRTNIGLKDYQPKTGFVNFYEANNTLILQTFRSFCQQNIKDVEIIQTKLKKTYKNRYFMFINK
jgi:hypothetical protein